MLRDNVLTFNPVIAQVVGVNEAIVLNQIDYWLEKNKEASRNFLDGCYWAFNTYEKWQKDNFFFWSKNTIIRAFKNLEKAKLIFSSSEYNKKKYDKTKWYSINYEEVGKILEKTELTPSEPQENPLPKMENPLPKMENPLPKMENPLPKMGRGDYPKWVEDEPKLGRPIPEITSETTTEITKENKDSINIAQNTENQQINSLFESENLSELPNEVKAAFQPPMQKFLTTYHVSVEDIKELIVEVVKRIYEGYEMNNPDSFKGLFYTSLENAFLDELLMVKGVNVSDFVKEERFDQLSKLRKNAKFDYFKFVSSAKNEIVQEMAATREEKKSKKKSQPKRQSRKPIRTEMLPSDWKSGEDYYKQFEKVDNQSKEEKLSDIQAMLAALDETSATTAF